MSSDGVFRALSDPTRRQILRLLSARSMSAGDIASHFEITAPSMSHHLTALRQAGLVTSQKQGQQVIYSINTSVMEDLILYFIDFRDKTNE